MWLHWLLLVWWLVLLCGCFGFWLCGGNAGDSGLLAIGLVFVLVWFVWLVSACGCWFVGYLHLALFAALVYCSFFV